MKFSLDQNFPSNFVEMLKQAGHEVITLKQLGKQTAKNGQVATIALDLNAIIVTFDRHFLSLKKELQQDLRVIYIELHPRDPLKASNLLQNKLNNCVAILKKPGVLTVSPDGITTKRY